MNKEKIFTEASYFLMALAPICAAIAIFFAKVGTEHIMRRMMLSAFILYITGKSFSFYHSSKKNTHHYL